MCTDGWETGKTADQRVIMGEVRISFQGSCFVYSYAVNFSGQALQS